MEGSFNLYTANKAVPVQAKKQKVTKKGMWEGVEGGGVHQGEKWLKSGADNLTPAGKKG